MEYVHVQGEQVPALGFGTYQLPGQECMESVMDALDIGYRHVDTAQAYGNEEQVGEAIEGSDVSRENVWLTTKLWRDNLERDKLRKSVEESLEKLRTNYLDLLLIHWPFPGMDLETTLEEMEKLVADGRVLHIGVSNFTPEQVEEAQEISNIPLFTDQVEYHPFLDQTELLETCRGNGMMLTAYSPLARGDVVGDETLEETGERYGKTAAQVALRWLVQQENVSAIPKAASGEHRRQNFDIFDFELSGEEMERITQLTSKNDRKIQPSFAPWG